MDLRTEIERRLPDPFRTALRSLGERAAQHREGLYLVGGAVRDLVLGRPSQEVDLVLVGDVHRLAQEAEEAGLVRRIARSQFLTLKLEIAGHLVDLVTARRESYARPGALPQVEPASLEEDLRRRDLSINALAASLAPADFGRVIDVCEGLDDLRAGLVRALHPASFRDDATRILRAARYERRLAFRLEEETESWLRRDASYLTTISADRLRHELDWTWREERPEASFDRLHDLGALAHLHSALSWDGGLTAAFVRARVDAPPDVSLPAAYVALLACRMEPAAAEGFIARLALPAPQQRAVRDAARLGIGLLGEEAPPARVSTLVERLEEYDSVAVFAHALTASGPWARVLRQYLEEWRQVRPALRGADLLALGFPSGPQIGAHLRRLRAAHLDGQVQTEAGERALVTEWLRGA